MLCPLPFMTALALPLALVSGTPLLSPPLPSRNFELRVDKLAKKPKEKEAETRVVSVTSAQMAGENIVGTWFYTLTGSVINNTATPVNNVVVHFEIVAPETKKLITAGSAVVEPAILGPGGQGQFKVEPNQTGQVKITLVEWSKPDRTYGSHSQMQVFP